MLVDAVLVDAVLVDVVLVDVEGAPDGETAGRDVVGADLDPDDAAAEEDDADDGGPEEQAVSAVQRTSAPVTARLRGDGMKASCPATAVTDRSGAHGEGRHMAEPLTARADVRSGDAPA